jgi:hypothetical protein
VFAFVLPLQPCSADCRWIERANLFMSFIKL